MASVGQACAHRVVCGFHVGSSMRCAQKMHFWASCSSSFQKMAP